MATILIHSAQRCNCRSILSFPVLAQKREIVLKRLDKYGLVELVAVLVFKLER